MSNNDNSKRPSGWIEVVIKAPAEQAEVAADFLVLLTGRGVETYESSSPGGPESVKAFLEAGPQSAEQIQAVEDLVRRLEARIPGYQGQGKDPAGAEKSGGQG